VSTPNTGGVDLFGGNLQVQPQADLFGGGADGFGGMQAAEPTFPSYICYEDNIIKMGLEFKRDVINNSVHTLTARFKNQT